MEILVYKETKVKETKVKKKDTWLLTWLVSHQTEKMTKNKGIDSTFKH